MTNHAETPTVQAGKKVSRRALLRLGCAGVVVAAAGAAGVLSQTDFMDRMQGVTHTPLLTDETAWSYADNTLTISLERLPQLSQPGSALRLEASQLSEPLLLVHGVDDQFYVYLNKCTHSGRKIDLDGSGQLTCCSVSQSTFSYAGAVLDGPAKSALTTYTIEQTENQLLITLA
ncbi:MAG TPA: Rieske (2Fe-2S) protein [Phototrophicaceae bacterium]|nr:Rieske (2Fe-2S) protein [Phototrophicaceae bacterium]